MHLHLVKRTNYFTRIILTRKRKIIDIEPPLRAHTHTRILRGRKIGRDARMRSVPFHKCFSTRFSIWLFVKYVQIPITITLRKKMQMRGVLRYSFRGKDHRTFRFRSACFESYIPQMWMIVDLYAWITGKLNICGKGPNSRNSWRAYSILSVDRYLVLMKFYLRQRHREPGSTFAFLLIFTR